jgi:hypothetical protein
MPLIAFGIAMIIASPSYAQFNSFYSGALMGVCMGLNPMCQVGKMYHDEQQRGQQDRKPKEDTSDGLQRRERTDH